MKFKRGSESHYSRNIIMFNEKLEQANFRITIGVCKDFECETHHLPGLKLHPGNVWVPEINYLNTNVVFTALPTSWF